MILLPHRFGRLIGPRAESRREMRRLTLEFPYDELWRRLLGPSYEKVEILEAIKSLKCDFEGLAIICRLRLKDRRMAFRDLVGKGAVRSVETLYKEKDGSFVVLIQGKPVVFAPPRLRPKDPNKARPGLVMTGPPEFVDTHRMRLQFLCRDEEMPRILEFYRRTKLSHKVVGVARLERPLGSDRAKLTANQRKALLAAYSLGYYQVPRTVSTEQLARRLGVAGSTLAEHLRKAERSAVAAVLGAELETAS